MRSTGRVLVVDDDDTIRELVSIALCDEGYEVMSAIHGREALERAAYWAPDLILLDMRMPVMDGWEFTRAYRRGPGPHAPIVVLTAGRDATCAATQLDADAALAKPFELESLLELVSRLIQTPLQR
ncbi:MAG: response regulator [Anaerolineae bacterium]